MTTHNFQGVDLDWEFPSSHDTTNFALLVQEMRARWGAQHGISVVLPPDYATLQNYDATAMQPSVDWFGFMSYDLHGPWDTNAHAGVLGQTDIRDITTDTTPLWFAGLDPRKINLGVAYYGRGYTLSQSSCNTLGCAFMGPSKPGACTNSAGIMSLAEIQALVMQKGLTPKLLQDSMMKQVTWDDQWMGYDDAETIGLKKTWGDGLGFGGTMIWSVDFGSPAGTSPGGTPLGPPTTDGTCGAANGGRTCVGWSTGSCCSSHGWCGGSGAYCGAGCQSGPCLG